MEIEITQELREKLDDLDKHVKPRPEEAVALFSQLLVRSLSIGSQIDSRRFAALSYMVTFDLKTDNLGNINPMLNRRVRVGGLTGQDDDYYLNLIFQYIDELEDIISPDFSAETNRALVELLNERKEDNLSWFQKRPGF